jgi:hypothetical protein
MKTHTIFCFLLFVISIAIGTPAQSIIYLSPRPNSYFISLNSNIIIRCDETVNTSSITTDKFLVQGNVSGIHTGEIKIADDQKTILFIPAAQFAPDEEVNVKIASGITTFGSKPVPELSFKFKTTKLSKSIVTGSELSEEPVSIQGESIVSKRNTNSRSSLDTLPANFPTITVGTSNNPSDGKIFIANEPKGNANAAIGNYLLILNNDGTPAAYKSLAQAASLFKMEPNGELSYNLKSNGQRIILDTTLSQVGTINCGNGYKANGHDACLLPNGHALLFANDPQPVDMSQVVPGGNPDATVTGSIIQEVDQSGNVIFQWRSWDYLSITDSYFDLTQADVDYMHPNAITLDTDGNILFSIRHFSSVIKINRATGDIEWVLGGKKNQFTFINENETNSPTYFSYQHDISVLPNGNITMFDNGNQHPTLYSRGVEYKLDVANRTATMVWEYRHSPDLYTAAMGSVQRLPNGNTLIGWGQTSLNTSPTLTEVHPDNSVALELYLPSGQISYRSYKYPWKSQTSEYDAAVDEILEGNTYTFNSTNDTTGIKIKFSSLNSELYTNAYVSKYCYAPVNPTFTGDVPNVIPYYFTISSPGIISYNGEVHVDLTKYPSIINPGSTIIYGRPSGDTTFTVQPTSYNSDKNELVSTTSILGQFIFAVPQTVSSLAPYGIIPANKEVVNGKSAVMLTWGTKGVVESCHLQVAADSSFTTTLIDKENITTTNYNAGILVNNSTYYWRVNNTNSAGTSSWSGTMMFTTAPPYISLTFPNGGNTIYVDSSYVIRWTSNISDTVNIELYRNDTLAQTIANSLVTGTNAYLWTVPSTLQAALNYKILVRDIAESNLSSKSVANFVIIKAGTSGINETGNNAHSFALCQNYPNPFNPSTTIRYTLPEESLVHITIYNILGQQVAILENTLQSAGEHEISWNAATLPSGFYVYSMQAVSSSGKTFASTKKMLLMK